MPTKWTLGRLQSDPRHGLYTSIQDEKQQQQNTNTKDRRKRLLSRGIQTARAHNTAIKGQQDNGDEQYTS